MSVGTRELRIHETRKPRVNLCGSCGARVGETELLCEACRNEAGYEPVDEMERRTR
jgi:predicted amidophosphoribosyltransferase